MITNRDHSIIASGEISEDLEEFKENELPEELDDDSLLDDEDEFDIDPDDDEEDDDTEEEDDF